jgi:hypothetical protein
MANTTANAIPYVVRADLDERSFISPQLSIKWKNSKVLAALDPESPKVAQIES